MQINKSTRHTKITGDFGETVVLCWLSKYGFECAPVDHTGIDIIANNPHTKEVMAYLSRVAADQKELRRNMSVSQMTISTKLKPHARLLDVCLILPSLSMLETQSGVLSFP